MSQTLYKVLLMLAPGVKGSRGGVYWYRSHIQVQMGHVADFRALHDELNANLRANGLVPFQSSRRPGDCQTD